MIKVVFNLSHLSFDACNELVGLVFVELQDALHFDFHEPQNIIARHVANEFGLKRREFFVDKSNGLIHRVGRFEFLFFIDALLNKDAFQTGEKELLEQFATPNLQFLAQQAHGAVHTVAQHIAHREETRFVVFNHTAVGRNINLAIAESIERINGFVGRHTWCQMHLNFHLGRRVVVHTFGLNLPLINGFQNTIDKRRGGFAERNFANNERLAIQLLNLRPHLQHTAALPIVIFAHVDGTACGEIGIESKRLATQIVDGGLANLRQIVGQQLAAQAHGNALCTLCQQQRKLHRQRDGLLIAPVIAQLPIGGFGIKHHV